VYVEAEFSTQLAIRGDVQQLHCPMPEKVRQPYEGIVTEPLDVASALRHSENRPCHETHAAVSLSFSSAAHSAARCSHVRFGSKADIGLAAADVRFTSENGYWQASAGCPLCARSGHLSYSITSSAMLIMPEGTARPRAFAVLVLITNSNFVGCNIGRSPGRSPLRIRPA
jgi:hypothetical protein